MPQPPLRFTSSRAFPHGVDDLLALAGELLSGIYRHDGRMAWQFTQGVTHRPPPGSGAFFVAHHSYTTGAYDGGGTMQHWTAGVQLTVGAHSFEQEGHAYCPFTLDVHGTNGDSTMDLIAFSTAARLARRLVERQWLRADQGAAFWQCTRGWSDLFITQAGRGDAFNLMLVLEKQGMFPGFSLHDPASAQRALSETVWMRALFDR